MFAVKQTSEWRYTLMCRNFDTKRYNLISKWVVFEKSNETELIEWTSEYNQKWVPTKDFKDYLFEKYNEKYFKEEETDFDDEDSEREFWFAWNWNPLYDAEFKKLKLKVWDKIYWIDTMISWMWIWVNKEFAKEILDKSLEIEKRDKDWNSDEAFEFTETIHEKMNTYVDRPLMLDQAKKLWMSKIKSWEIREVEVTQEILEFIALWKHEFEWYNLD